ncbi:MAG: MFS transporter [Rhodospirillaceae bacterium]|nr:MFS transporter [Rhodospirillaceae bacterium]
MSAVNRVFFGWWVAWSGFLMALFAWGFGFYGSGVFLTWFTERHGWALADVSLAITAYYAVSATVIVFSGDLYQRLGHRVTCLLGVASLGLAALATPLVDALWQVWCAYGVMALGWALLGTAGVNIALAPWFEKKRGFVVSLALNGASMGAVVIAPVMVLLAAIYSPLWAVVLMVGLMVATLGVMAVVTLGKTPQQMGLYPDGLDAAPAKHGDDTLPTASKRALLAGWPLWSVALPFAMALFVQVGMMTHQFRFLTLNMGESQAALIMALSGIMAVIGRVGTGFIVDRVDRRLVACINFSLQGAALALLTLGSDPALIWAGWLLFGLGVGNQVTLSGLIVQVEFSRRDFARAIALVVAITQATYAFGPGSIGVLAQWSGSYTLPLMITAVILAAAAILIMVGRPGPR